MANRDRDFYDDRDTFYTTGSGAPPRRRGTSDADVYERYEEVRREDGPVRSRIQVRERERERDDDSRVPHFMREDRRGPPQETSGAMVLRQREVETVSRPRPRSPSQVRFEERTHIFRRARSPSPSVVSEPLPPPPVQRRERVEVRDRVQYENRRPAPRSPSPHPSRGRSLSRERIRIIERSKSRERIPSPSPSPPPPAVPEVIRGPTIEREVITHYRNIDHGVVQAPRPPPSPAPPRPILKTREVEITRDTDIDITRGRGRTDVDVEIRRRSVSRERGALVIARRSPSPAPPRRAYDDLEHRHKLRVDIEDRHRSTSVTAEHSHSRGHRRSHSAMPDYRDEAERITNKIDSRGRHGEAWNGATRDWTIVDVPPGTERVRMEGAGGAAADITWERYSGVRRSRFIPERDAESSSSSATTTVVSERERDRVVETNDRLNVQVIDKRSEIEIEKTTRGRGRRPKTEDMWTEITRDLVTREAIEEMGYDYEQRGPFFYIMQYLQYEDVLQLVELSDEIRRHRRRHLREIEYEREREYHDDRRRRRSKYDYDHEVVVGVDREVVYDRPPVRGYLR